MVKTIIKNADDEQGEELATKLMKIALFQHNGDAFQSFAKEQLKSKKLNKTEQIFLKHQLMRYYVSVEADFDQSFIYVIQLRELLDGNKNNVLYPNVLADVYFVAFWIKQVQHDLVKAREYAELMLVHSEKYQLSSSVIRAKLGLAELTQHEGKVDEGIVAFKEIEEDVKASSDSTKINRLYLLLSNAYIDKKNEDSAFVYAQLAFNYVPYNNVLLKSFNTIHLARGYINIGEVDNAIKLGKEALKNVEGLGNKKEIKDLNHFLFEAHKSGKHYKEALYHLEMFLELDREQASLLSAANISNLEAKLEKNKNNHQMKLKQEEVMRKNATIAQQKTQTIALIIVLLFALGIIVIAIRSYVIKKRDAETIMHQKLVVEEKNQEIMDSITYAKRIQSAILPPNKLVKEYLERSFILYKPKDIVAGDFYWMEHKDGKVMFAAADCTGHGVPGAMVSVLCNGGLNRSVREYGLTDPGKILDKTREIVIEEFEKSEDEVNDGMDIALCCLDYADKSTTPKLTYAGANNPLWIIRKGEIIETRANKQPIGKFSAAEPFVTHEFELLAGDTIYVFSDGYLDQFGGEKGKKFKAQAFRELLLSIQDKTMEEQQIIIDETFETWRGALDQIDDVCVIGVRV